MYWPLARMLFGILARLVRQDAPLVRAGDAAQAALLDAALRQGERPEHDGIRAAVGAVLVPAREGLAVGLLHPPGHAPAAEVGTDQVLEGVEDVGILGDLEHPWAEQVRLRLHLLDVGDARFERIELPAVVRGALGAHRADGREAAVALERVDLGLGQDLGHGSYTSDSTRIGVSCAGL